MFTRSACLAFVALFAACLYVFPVHAEPCAEAKDVEACQKKRCDGGELDGCVSYGLGLEARGKRKKALKVLQRACDKGAHDGCNALAWTYWTRYSEVRAQRSPSLEAAEAASRDAEFALSLLEETCAAGHQRSCLDAYGRLLELSDQSRGDSSYGERAEAVYEQLLAIIEAPCHEGDLEVCYSIATDYANGRGLIFEPVTDKAIELYTLACKGGHAPSCEALLPYAPPTP